MPAKMQSVLDHADQIYTLAKGMEDEEDFIFIGRHVGYPIALEGALKLKEIAYLHAEGFAAGELKHGPIAIINPGMPVFAVVPRRAVTSCTTRWSAISRRSVPAVPAPSPWPSRTTTRWTSSPKW